MTVLLDFNHGAFSTVHSYDMQASVAALAVGDFNGDGSLDIVTANNYYPTLLPANSATILLGDGHGNFRIGGTFPVGNGPAALAVADFNGDGQLDLATVDANEATVTVLLGTGAGTFLTRPCCCPAAVQSTPLIASLTSPQALDAIVLTETGQILFRRGLADDPGAFAPPIILNPDPQLAARDLALVKTAGGATILAALDADTVTLYKPNPDGTFTITTLTDLNLPTDFLPANIASDDLTGNGWGDLVITAAASNKVFVSLQIAPGVFGAATAYAVGVNPSAIALTFVDDDNRRDIVVTDRFSGQVSVLINQGDGTFRPEQRFRAGTGLYGLTPENGTDAVQSLEGTNGVVAGSFDGNPGADLVVTNSGTDSFVLLPGDGLGGFLNPQSAETFFTGSSPTAIVQGHFIAGDPNLDLAILSKDTGIISIWRSDGLGGFTQIGTVDAGNQPTGLSVADVSQPGGGGPDGNLDLLVGNAFGDLLILTGDGQGHFAEYRRVDQAVSLAVAGTGTDQRSFLFSDQGNDQLAYQLAAVGTSVIASPTIYQTRTAGIPAPGPGDHCHRPGHALPGRRQQRRE